MAKAYAGPVLSHWSTLIEDFHTSALDFYTSVTAALARREAPKVRTSRVAWSEGGLGSAQREYLRIESGKFRYDICAAPFGTGYFFSSWLVEKRPSLAAAIGFVVTYFVLLAIAWTGIVFLLQDAYRGLAIGGWLPLLVTLALFFPGALILFWILAQVWGERNVVLLPVIGPFYAWLFNPQTFYRYDTALMFQKCVHNAVMEAIDALTTEKGMRALAPDDRKPTLSGFFDRAA